MIPLKNDAPNAQTLIQQPLSFSPEIEAKKIGFAQRVKYAKMPRKNDTMSNVKNRCKQRIMLIESLIEST